MAERFAFECKNIVKLGRGNITSLEFGPCVFVVVDRVDRADEIERQAVIPLIVVESIKRAGQNYAPKIKKYGSQHA